MASKIGEVPCTACGSTAFVNEGKGGTLSIACQGDGCKALTMVKSPSAVGKLRAKISGSSSSSSSSSAAPAAAGKSLEEFLK